MSITSASLSGNLAAFPPAILVSCGESAEVTAMPFRFQMSDEGIIGLVHVSDANGGTILLPLNACTALVLHCYHLGLSKMHERDLDLALQFPDQYGLNVFRATRTEAAHVSDAEKLRIVDAVMANLAEEAIAAAAAFDFDQIDLVTSDPEIGMITLQTMTDDFARECENALRTSILHSLDTLIEAAELQCEAELAMAHA